MIKAIKIRLYPTETQQITINKLLGCCRLVYNCCLNHRNHVYEETKKGNDFADQIAAGLCINAFDSFAFNHIFLLRNSFLSDADKWCRSGYHKHCP